MVLHPGSNRRTNRRNHSNRSRDVFIYRFIYITPPRLGFTPGRFSFPGICCPPGSENTAQIGSSAPQDTTPARDRPVYFAPLSCEALSAVLSGVSGFAIWIQENDKNGVTGTYGRYAGVLAQEHARSRDLFLLSLSLYRYPYIGKNVSIWHFDPFFDQKLASFLWGSR